MNEKIEKNENQQKTSEFFETEDFWANFESRYFFNRRLFTPSQVQIFLTERLLKEINLEVLEECLKMKLNLY